MKQPSFGSGHISIEAVKDKPRSGASQTSASTDDDVFLTAEVVSLSHTYPVSVRLATRGWGRAWQLVTFFPLKHHLNVFKKRD